ESGVNSFYSWFDEDELYFTTVKDDGKDATPDVYELWKTDGTPRGTERVQNLGKMSSLELQSSSSGLYYTARDKAHGVELWKLETSENTGSETLTGTRANDSLIGTDGPDLIDGKGGNDTISGLEGNDSLNGGTGQDNLTGNGGADTFIFQFGQSRVARPDAIADLEIGTDKIDLLTQGGDEMDAPSRFTRAGNNKAQTLAQVVNRVFEDANGARDGNQELGINSAALVRATNRKISGTYLVINDDVAGFQRQNDLVVNITGYSGDLPELGNISVEDFFAL
ncbi:bluetail domain-containing putative surface protein, partial [Lyngbya sp. CCY1209]|uniref:bluetail domain-containing putative surface protein n=1 Tax=Lyngbya sp. CCY1209 TaxID=2886103 RepID=UPI002D2060C7